MNKKFSRRDFIKVGGLALLGTAGAVTANQTSSANQDHAKPNKALHTSHVMQQGDHGDLPGTVGEVDHEANGFNPTDILTDFDYGDGIHLAERTNTAGIQHRCHQQEH